MRKLKRSARIVHMTHQLIQSPHTLLSLTHFADEYGSAKSSISEDLAIIKEVFEGEGVGELRTVAGAAGGVLFIPRMPKEDARSFMQGLLTDLSTPNRLLSGGYLYMSDILGDPRTLAVVGRMFATYFADRAMDFIMTVETKGIPIAYAVAQQLQLPVIIVRRDSKVTEGSVVTINYVSGSTKRIQTMSLGRRSMPPHARVLVIDDFMKAGGTIRGMYDLLHEFQAEVVGTGVLVEDLDTTERLVDQYVSLARLYAVDSREKKIELRLGSYFDT